MTAPLLEVTPDGKLRVNFHPGQLRAWDSTKRIVAVIAGGRSGKTSFAPLWLHREMIRKGPGDYLVAAPNYPLIDKAAGPEIEHFFGRLLKLGELKRSPSMQFVFSPDGAARLWGKKPERPARILFGHAEEPESLEAMSAKAAWLDEAGQNRFRSASYEAVQQRLSIDAGRCLITTKPYNLGWLKLRVYDPWKAADGNHPDIDVICFDSLANPAFPPEEYERARAALPAWRFNMTYRGLFSRPAGLIYESFDSARHVVKRFGLPPRWPRYVGLDFGPVNTAAVFLAAETDAGGKETGKLFLYRTYHPARRGGPRLSPKEHVAALLAGEPGVPTAVGGSASEGEWRGDFGAAGLHVHEPPVRDVEVGIDRGVSAFRENKVFVFDDCADFLDEVQSYSRELNDAGQPTEKIENKADWHVMDAFRYVISYLRSGGGEWVSTPDPAAPLEVFRAASGTFHTNVPGRRVSGDPGDDEGGGEWGPLIPPAW